MFAQNLFPNTLPNPRDIARRIASTDPVLAYWLVQAERRLPGYYSLNWTIVTGTTEKPLEQSFKSNLGEDFFVLDIRSTVSRPNFAAGSLFKAQSDYFNALSPGMKIRAQVVGGQPGQKYVFNDYYTSLETFAPNANGQGKSIVCGLDAVLSYSQNVKADLILTREYTNDELPAYVEVTFVGWSLGCQGYFNSMPRAEACAKLGQLQGFEHLKAA